MKLGRDVQPEALRRFREERGWTHEQLADLVWASPLEVEAWEAGTVAVPLEQARRIRECDRADRRSAVQRATTLARCEWADAHSPGLHESVLEWPFGLSRFGLDVQSHLISCHTCDHVFQFARGLRKIKAHPDLGSHFPDALGRFLDTRPRIVLYPVLIGTGTAVAVAIGLLLGQLPDAVKEGVMSDEGLALGYGAAVFGIFGTYLRDRVPRRPFLRGIVKSAVGALVTLLAWHHLDPATHPLSGPVLLAGAAAAGAMGVLSGLWSRWKGEHEDDARPASVQAGPAPPRLQDAGVAGPDVSRPTAEPVFQARGGG